MAYAFPFSRRMSTSLPLYPTRDVAFMTQFRVRDLLTLTLLAGVAFVWLFETHDGISAHVLLNARNTSKTLNSTISPLGEVPPVSDRELVKTLKLEPWVETPDWVGSPFSYNRGLDMTVDAVWLDTPVNFHWELDPDHSLHVIWNADWDAIKRQAVLTNRLLTTRSILTAFVVGFILWFYNPIRRANYNAKDRRVGPSHWT